MFSATKIVLLHLDDLHAIDILDWSDNEMVSEAEVGVGRLQGFDFSQHGGWTKNSTEDFCERYGRFTQKVVPTTILPETATASELCLFGYSVVTRLCRLIHGKWHTVYFDQIKIKSNQSIKSNQIIICTI